MSATALGGRPTYQIAQTRVIPPHHGAQLVRRDRLIGRLASGSQLPLTVVTGPAGSGKTSLLGDWALTPAPMSPPAWVSLEREDRDAARFWSAVTGAIEASGETELARGLRALRGDRTDFLAALGNLLDTAATPLRLVLDDFHDLQGSPAAGEIDALLRHPPAGLRLIIASRADPVLSLHRLRMSAQLAEVRGADLAFTEPEAGELFTRAGVELAAAQVGALVRRTEGWAAGLRLAALSLADSQGATEFIRDFTGDDRAVAEYLVEQALDSQPDDVRDFMLRTSIVDAVTSDLADALTGNADGARILEQLVRDNIFITGHHQPHGWFRYHRMFGELLQAQLRHRSPQLVTLEHRRAAHWYARNDLSAPAARHALAADDPELAARTMCRGWLRLLLEGHPAAVTPSIARLPEAVVARNPELAMAAAALLFESGRPQDARGFMALGERGASHVDPHRRRHWLLSRTVAQIYAHRDEGDYAAVATGAGKLLSGLGSDISQLSAADGRAFALLHLGVAQTWLGEPDPARRSLEDALALAQHASRDYLVGNALGALAVHHARAGELRRARQVGEQALALGERGGWADRPAAHGARLALATCAGHQGCRREARQQLDLLAGATSLEPPLAVGARILRARLELRAGELELARIALASIRRDADGHGDRGAWFAGAAEAEAEALCGLGSGDEALSAIGSVGATAELPAELVRARLALAAGAPERVTNAGPLPLGGPGSTGAGVELLALTAVAHHQCGSDPEALEYTERALERAAPDGYVDPFLAVGRPIRELIGRRIRLGTAYRALAGTVVELLDPRAPAPGLQTRTLLLEPLSERELTVLRYLPTPLSKAEIAAEMFVTVNTVKTHIKSIYRKLDVGNRVEAVKRARARALI